MGSETNKTIVKMPRDSPPLTSKSRLVWVDCEMTGLDYSFHRIVEIACIITEPDLKVVATLGPIAIQQPPEVIENMSDWCKNMFEKNGLSKRIKESSISERQAEVMLLEFLKEHTKPKECPLAGNSVYMDKIFLQTYMPSVVEHLHYRIVDVSTLKEIVKRWYTESQLKKIPEKRLCHLALDDIKESIEELRCYKNHFFIKNEPLKMDDGNKTVINEENNCPEVAVKFRSPFDN